MAETKSSVSVKNIEIARQSQSTRELYAHWDKLPDGKNYDNQENFEYKWRYYADGYWFEADTGTAAKNIPTCTYSPPDNATKVTIYVKAVPTKKQFSCGWAHPKKSYEFSKHKISKHKVSDLGISEPSGTTLTATWRDEKYAGVGEVVSGYDYLWEYFNGNIWIQDASGTVQNTDVSSLRYGTTYTIPETAEIVQITVTPVPVAEYLFVGDPESAGYWITKTNRSVKNVSITNNNNGTVTGYWQISDSSMVASFTYEWSYWLNKTWTSSTGTVSIDENANGSGKKRSWGSTYSVPSGSDHVRLRVLPVGEEGSAVFYQEEWSEYTHYRFEIEDKTILDGSFKATKIADTARSYVLEWGLTEYSTVASFNYEVQYKIASSTLWLNHSSGSVDVGTGQKTKETTTIYVLVGDDTSGDTPVDIVPKTLSIYKWAVTYDAPENAVAFRIRVKCNPTYENAFNPAWSTWETVKVTTPSRSIDKDSLEVAWYNQAERTLMARFFMTESTGVASCTVTWEYSYNKAWWPGETDTVTLTKNYGVYGYGYATYQAPEETKTVRVTIEPVPSVSGTFIPQPVSLKYPWNVSSVNVDSGSLSIEILQDTDRSMIGRWTASKVPTELTDSFEYQWAYKIGNDWFYESSETLTELAQQVTNPYDAPEQARAVMFRIRPVASSTNFYIGSWSSWKSYWYSISSRIIKKSDIDVFLMRGTDRTVIATWDIDNEDNVDSYSYTWRYSVDGIWLGESTGSASVTTPSCTYDAPANASLVEFTVIPVPRYSTSFVGKWSTPVVFEVPDQNIPETPSTPTVTVDGMNLTVQVDTYDEHTSKIEFEIVTETRTFDQKTISVVLNRATWTRAINPGTSYRVRCRGINEDKEAGEWSQYSSDVYSSPVAPNISSCKALSATSIRVSWGAIAASQHVSSYTLEYVVENSEYFETNPSAITSNTYSGTTADITGLDPSASGRYYFRVKATNDQNQDSQWSALSSCILGTTPSAPTTWSSTTTATTDRDIYLYWVHNSEDSSTESSAILELKVNNTTTTQTITNTSGSENYTGSYRIPAGTYSSGAKIQWRVRTKGVVDSYGPYSTQRVVDIYAAPTLSMNIRQGNNEELVDGTITRLPIILNLNAGPAAQTPVSYYITITAETAYVGTDINGTDVYITKGATVFSRYVSSSSRSWNANIAASDVILESGYSYRITTVLTMNSGLTAQASQVVAISWEEADIYLNAESDYDPRTVTMTLRPYCEDEAGNIVADVTLAVYRREFDGTFTEIARNIENRNRRVSVIDPHPALDLARYRIVATSKTTGRVFFYDIPGYPIYETSIVIQWDEQWQSFDVVVPDGTELVDAPYSGSILKLPYNIDTDESNSIDVELINYIGRRNPVSYYGTQVGQTANWNTDVDATDMETIYALRRLSVYMGDVYVREPSGTGYWANVKVSFGRKHIDTVIPVSLEITRVEGGA